MLQISDPILTSIDLMKIRSMNVPGFKVQTISILYYKNTPLDRAIQRMFVAADRAYRKGANILILSDRGVDENRVAIPSLLAVSALQQYLVRTKKRTSPVHRPGVGGAPGGPPLCHSAGLRRGGHQPLPGPGVH